MDEEYGWSLWCLSFLDGGLGVMFSRLPSLSSGRLGLVGGFQNDSFI